MNRALGRRIIQKLLAAVETGDGPRVDDGRAFLQMRQGSARHVEVTEDVCLESPLELIVRDVRQTVLALLKGGVVNEDVESIEFIDDSLHSLFAELRIANVAGDR